MEEMLVSTSKKKKERKKTGSPWFYQQLSPVKDGIGQTESCQLWTAKVEKLWQLS